MKKLFFTGVFVVIASVTFSQTLIPKAGLSLSKFGGSDVEDNKFNLGFTLGIGANFPLGTGLFSLQPELNFVQKGSKFEEDGITEKMKVSYMEIPVLLKASFGESTKFYFNAGPSLGLGLGGKYKVSEGSQSAEFDVKFGTPEEEEEAVYIEKRTDIGLQMGGGVIIADKVMIDIRYGLGLTSLYEDGTIKNNVLQFTVGVPLNLK